MKRHAISKADEVQTLALKAGTMRASTRAMETAAKQNGIMKIHLCGRCLDIYRRKKGCMER